MLGVSPSPTALPDHDSSLGAPPSPPVLSAIAPAPGIFGATTIPTLVATSTSTSATPPEPTLLDALRESTEEHHLTLSTLAFDLSEYINSSCADNLAQREATDRIALDLKTSITTQSTKDDAFRDEISATMRLLAETQHLKHEELKLLITNALLKAPSASLPDETEPPPTGRGASRFTPPPWSRGARSLRDTTRQPARFANPCHPAPADLPSSSPDKTTYRASTGTPNHPLDRHGAPCQRQRDAPGKLGDSPSTSHDKRHATYCRKLDVASVPDSRKYAVVAVVSVNTVSTVCATEQFRTWTLTRPQSTTVTIETAIWSLLHVGVLDARDIFAEFNPVFCDFRYRIGYGETTNDTLDGILRLTFPDSRDTDPQTSVDAIAQ